MRSGIAAVVASVLVCGPALADGQKAALAQFGLIGAWSSDCGKDVHQAIASRVTFASPPGGPDTATAVDGRGAVWVTTVYAIVESNMPTADQIDLALHPLRVTHSDGETAGQHEYDNLRLVFEKAGERIQLTRVQFEGLPEIKRQIMFEKCAD
jgi:hypothetical protein